MADPEKDPSYAVGEFGEVIDGSLDDAAVPAKPGEGAKPEDEAEAHPS